MPNKSSVAMPVNIKLVQYWEDIMFVSSLLDTEVYKVLVS